MSSYSKTKGKTYELEFSKKLEKVFTLPFHRVPNSGATLGKSNINNIQHFDQNQINILSGDIIPPQELSHIEFECKFHRDIGKISSWFDGNSIIDDWITQVSITTKPFWFLCWKLNNLGEFILFKQDYPFSIIGNHLTYGGIYFICRLTWDDKGFFNINKEKLLTLKPVNT